MKIQNFIEVLAIFVGFMLGILLYASVFPLNLTHKKIGSHRNIETHKTEPKIVDNSAQYDTTLADKLFNEVKVLCLMLTQPSTHKSKAYHARDTWGRKCNKLILLSSENDTEIETFSIHRKESRDILWGKVRNGFEQAYNKYFNDYDWFMKADDDSYLIMENLRHKLYQFNPNTSIVVGHKYSLNLVKDGYMAGAGYILSKKALQKLVTKSFKNNRKCRKDDGGSEDLELGRCLQQEALFLDGYDLKREAQFFPLSVDYHMSKNKKDRNFWYLKYMWFNKTFGGLECCSKYLTCMHYIEPKSMHQINFLTYNVHPFGLDRHNENELPRKFTFDELVQMADEKSSSPYYVEHKIVHNFEPDEKF